MIDLVKGERSIYDDYIQATNLDWMESEDYNIFTDPNGKEIYALSPKRGNVVYATRKTLQKNSLVKAVEDKEFDFPIANSQKYRMTKLLFVTLSFDPTLVSPEWAWAMLRSSPVERLDYKYNVLNRFDANLSKIFGKHGRLVCKEAQANGYPAPHMIIVLDEPVRVELRNGRNGPKWRLYDPKVLRRIGKSSDLRRLAFKDHRKAIRMNPIWKYGFVDFEGIVKGYRFKNKKNAMSYPFKYLTKCLTQDSSFSISDVDSINEIKDPAKRTILFTHLGNKCFRTRDITFGKGFKNRIGLLPPEKKSKPSKWSRIKTVPGYVYEYTLRKTEEHNIKAFRQLFCEGAT